jgi:predicted amidohydrolase
MLLSRHNALDVRKQELRVFMNELPVFKAAAVQAAPRFLDADATVAKACKLIAEAASNGAKLVVFPEVFVPGYPYWNWCMTPLEGSSWFRRLCLSAIEIPGPEIDVLCEAARAAGIYLVIGVNERSNHSLATIYNTNVIISPQGVVIGRHRKLVPTFAEKLTWASGDGSSMRVYESELGRIGMLACGENTNTLARFTLLAQGELIHIANYIGFPFVENYDMTAAIQIRAGAHSFEGKIFTIVSCSAMSQEIIDTVGVDDKTRKMLSGKPNAFSGIFGPDGRLVTPPLIDDEGIVYAEIDINRCIEPKQYHDIVGAYNRFDIFKLSVDRTAQSPAQFGDDPPIATRAQSNIDQIGLETVKIAPRNGGS